MEGSFGSNHATGPRMETLASWPCVGHLSTPSGMGLTPRTLSVLPGRVDHFASVNVRELVPGEQADLSGKGRKRDKNEKGILERMSGAQHPLPP